MNFSVKLPCCLLISILLVVVIRHLEKLSKNSNSLRREHNTSDALRVVGSREAIN